MFLDQVLCTGNSLKGLAVEGVAGGDPIPFHGDGQLVTFLYRYSTSGLGLGLE